MMDPALLSLAHNWSNEFTILHWVCMHMASRLAHHSCYFHFPVHKTCNKARVNLHPS